MWEVGVGIVLRSKGSLYAISITLYLYLASSLVGLGVVLLQEQDGVKRVISF